MFILQKIDMRTQTVYFVVFTHVTEERVTVSYRRNEQVTWVNTISKQASRRLWEKGLRQGYVWDGIDHSQPVNVRAKDVRRVRKAPAQSVAPAPKRVSKRR